MIVTCILRFNSSGTASIIAGESNCYANVNGLSSVTSSGLMVTPPCLIMIIVLVKLHLRSGDDSPALFARSDA